jgi:hypothetical protein
VTDATGRRGIAGPVPDVVLGMALVDRCDEIIDLIDRVLRESVSGHQRESDRLAEHEPVPLG